LFVLDIIAHKTSKMGNCLPSLENGKLYPYGPINAQTIQVTRILKASIMDGHMT